MFVASQVTYYLCVYMWSSYIIFLRPSVQFVHRSLPSWSLYVIGLTKRNIESKKSKFLQSTKTTYDDKGEKFSAS